MDIRGIRYFICLAENLNFTRAAKECFITQTAMSQHIANMEKEVGFTLFNRNNRNVQLTSAGRDFYEQMKIVLRSYDTAVIHGQNISHGDEGSVIIAMPSCIEALVFRSRLRHFRQLHPTINIIINIVSPREMVDVLKHREADLVINWPFDMQESDDIAVLSLGEFKAQAVVSDANPLSGMSSVSPERLSKEPLVQIDMRGMPATQRALFSDWKRLNLNPPITPLNHINNMDELLMAVTIQDMVALVPEFVCNNVVSRNIAFLDIDMPEPPTFKLSEAHLKSNSNAALNLVRDVLRNGRIPLDY